MEIKKLMQTFRQPGLVERITVRPGRSMDVIEVNRVEAEEGIGLQGDRYNGRGGARQVTLIQIEHLAAMASILGVEAIDFALTRRNILVSGINLLALKDKEFMVGDAMLRYSGECHPCSRMEEAFGPGAYNAMRGHGGITARVVQGGSITTGDRVMPIAKESQATIFND
ncbi:MAG: MOSC domain-containing protein [Chryseolinea sp.]